MNRDYDNHDRFNMGPQLYPTVRFLIWCAVGMLLALALYHATAPAQAQTVHHGASPDGWAASVTQGTIQRAPAWPRTYRLTPLPDVQEGQQGHSVTLLDRQHLDAIIAWSLLRQAQREDMARRHRAGIVHPDEM